MVFFLKNKIKFEKICLNFIKCLYVIVIFLIISTLYNYFLGNSYYYTNNFKYTKNISKIKESIDKISLLSSKSKYSKEDIDNISSYLNSKYDNLILLSKEKECSSCSRRKYIKSILKHQDILNQISNATIIKNNIHNEDILNKLYSFDFYFDSNDIDPIKTESTLTVNYFVNSIYYENISLKSINNLYTDFLSILDDIYKEVSNYE